MLNLNYKPIEAFLYKLFTNRNISRGGCFSLGSVSNKIITSSWPTQAKPSVLIHHVSRLIQQSTNEKTIY